MSQRCDSDSNGINFDGKSVEESGPSTSTSASTSLYRPPSKRQKVSRRLPVDFDSTTEEEQEDEVDFQRKNGRSGKVSNLTLGKNRRQVPSQVGSRSVSQSFFKRKNTLLEKAKEIHETTGADCVLYLKSPGGTEYVYKSAGVNFDLGKINVQDGPQQKEDVPSTSSMDPRTSLSLSPIRSRTRHTETQTSESSFSTVQDSTLCRFCGEGRKDTKALWIGCSHVSQRGRVKQTCEYWVHALCVGITATTKAPLSRIGWKCPHHIMIAKDNAKDKNKKSK